MKIPQKVIEPFGFTGMPTATEEDLMWAKCSKELEEAISTNWGDGDLFYAPYIPMQVVKVFDNGKWVNVEMGRESLEDTTSGN
jgi:hypothetical protein